MIPGEYQIQPGRLPQRRARNLRVIVENHGDRPIQVGSHYHFYEVNPALKFD
jgi:urease subunit beta